MLLEIKDISVSFRGETVLDRVSFHIRGKEKIAIVGRNGAGKSTLLHLIEGTQVPDSTEKTPGAGIFWSRDCTVRLLGQNPVEDPDESVREMLEHFAAENADQNPQMLAFHKLFTKLGFSLADENRRLGDFSGGELTKIMLAALLVVQPEVLLLDEPTNHLDLETIQWLEEELREYPGSVVLVSHDRYFLDQVAEVTWELSGGSLTEYPGNYSSYRKEKAARFAKQKSAYEAQQQEIRRLTDLVEKFKHKPRKAAFARSRVKMLERMELISAPQTDDAVIHTGDIVPERPGSRTVIDCDHLLIGYDKPVRNISLRIRRGQKIGIFGANGTGKSTLLKTIAGLIPPYSDNKPTGAKNVDSGKDHTGPDKKQAGSDKDQEREDKNQAYADKNQTDADKKQAGLDKDQTGADKDQADLDKNLAGVDKKQADSDKRTAGSDRKKAGEGSSHPSHNSSRLHIGDNIDIGYFDQLSANIESESNVFDWFHQQFPDMPGEEEHRYLAGFLFHGEDFGRKVSQLSGGEKARLVLAAILARRPNLLLLDEPTNNMDIPAKETLESIFRDYKGTILFVSHDRYFLSKVADGLLFFPSRKGTQATGADPEGAFYFPSGYDRWMERQKRIARGEDVSITRNAEDQRLLEGLRQVPKRERHELHISDRQAALDWQLRLNAEEREPAEEAYQAADAKLYQIPEIISEEMSAASTENADAILDRYWQLHDQYSQQAEETCRAWTKTLAEWYDLYQEGWKRR